MLGVTRSAAKEAEVVERRRPEAVDQAPDVGDGVLGVPSAWRAAPRRVGVGRDKSRAASAVSVRLASCGPRPSCRSRLSRRRSSSRASPAARASAGGRRRALWPRRSGARRGRRRRSGAPGPQGAASAGVKLLFAGARARAPAGRPSRPRRRAAGGARSSDRISCGCRGLESVLCACSWISA